MREANKTSYGLGGIWTKDISTATPWREVRAGTVGSTCYNVFDASMPIGGYKQPDGPRRWATRPSRPTPKFKAVGVTTNCNTLEVGPGPGSAPTCSVVVSGVLRASSGLV